MWDDLKKRKLGQWVLGYGASAWVLYEVLSLISQNFDWPPAVIRLATVVLGVGLALVVVVAWFHGEKGHQRVVLAEVVLIGGILVGGAVAGRAVWRAASAETGAPAVPVAVAPSPPRNSLAVLPLTNQSGDPGQDFLSDGMSEELMVALARVPGLRLAARTSSFAFKERGASADSIARALGVRHLLDGSVSRRGDTLRVSVALVDAEQGYEVWSANYRRPAADIFALQVEIARSVVDALPLDPVLLEAEWELPDFSTDLEAHDLYLLGRQAWARRTGEDHLRAIEYFERALEIDPDYALAWAGLADVYVVLPGYTSVSPRTSLTRLRNAAERALALDSLLVSVHTALGYGTAWGDRDFARGIEQIGRALEIDPEYANALHWRGELLAHAGRFEEARAHFSLALEIDPLSGVTTADFGQALQVEGDHAAAAELLEAYLAQEPDYLIAQYWLLYPTLLLGRYDRARELARSLAEALGMDPGAMERAVGGVEGTVPRDEAVAALDAQPRSGPGISIVILAALYGQLGALDQGFDLLDDGRDGGQVVVYLNTHHVFEPYRADPRAARYAEMVRLR